MLLPLLMMIEINQNSEHPKDVPKSLVCQLVRGKSNSHKISANEIVKMLIHITDPLLPNQSIIIDVVSQSPTNYQAADYQANHQASYAKVNSNVYLAPSLKQQLLQGWLPQQLAKIRLYTNGTVFLLSLKQVNQMGYALSQLTMSGDTITKGDLSDLSSTHFSFYLPDRWSNDSLVELLDLLETYDPQLQTYNAPLDSDWLNLFTLAEFLDIEVLEQLASLESAQDDQQLRYEVDTSLPLAKKWIIYLRVPVIHKIPQQLLDNPEFWRQWLLVPKFNMHPLPFITLEQLLPKDLLGKTTFPYNIRSPGYSVYGVYTRHAGDIVLSQVVLHDTDHYPLLEAEVVEVGRSDNNKAKSMLNGGFYVYWPKDSQQKTAPKLRELTYYQLGHKQGAYSSYYRTGQLHETGSYSQDKLVGVRTTFDGRGDIIRQQDFN